MRPPRNASLGFEASVERAPFGRPSILSAKVRWMAESDGLIFEAISLVRERPCHRPECLEGELTDPSHLLCQQIRDFVERAEAYLAG